MGTIFQVVVRADDAASAQRLAEEAFATAEHWDDVLTTWRPDGELARFNRAAGSGWVEISPDLRRALERMLAAADETQGAFNPAVGKLVASLRAGAEPSRRPRDLPRLRDVLEVEGDRARLSDGIELDAGGIGKGMALDAVAQRLRQQGAAAVYLDFGGSSQLAFGFAEDRPTLAVAGLRDGEVLGRVSLDGMSLSTSRSPAAPGAGPIVDPRDGHLIAAQRVVTVAAPSATDTEVWSTALIVLGRAGVPLARAEGIEVLFADAAGVVRSDGFPIDSPPRGTP